MYRILLALLLLTGTSQAATLTWVIDKPAEEIAGNMLDLLRDADGASLVEVLQKYTDRIPGPAGVTLHEVLDKVPIHWQIDMWPAEHCYRSRITLTRSIGKLHSVTKTLTIWAQSDRTVFQATLEIGYGRHLRCRLLRRIKARVVNKVETGILVAQRLLVYRLGERND